ncbi:MAG TPA: hypothetical protein PKC39_03800 [Ferruginibacter sp.]|nr:hypothetical protein [Ferruginibacter sp.]HMP20063.1 hypothetical protein [Ferruginibacter sp.]
MPTFLLSLIIALFANASSSNTGLQVDISYTTNPGLPGNHIFYTPGKKLAISDFQGAPDPNSPAVAITSSGFAFKAGGKRNSSGQSTLAIEVYCNFNRAKSWMKEKGKNEYILGHEQLHFDISYWAAMLFIKKLRAASFKPGQENDIMTKLYQDAAIALEKKQNQYDAETQNGQIEDKQAAWAEKVQQEIAELSGN